MKDNKENEKELDKENNKEVKEDKTKKEEAQKEESKVDPKDARIAELEKEVASWKDKAYRTLADTDNLRKSYEKDHQNLIKYRGQPFLEKLLPSIDNFYLVLKAEQTDPVLKNYLMGFNMIYNSMLSSLADEGVEQIIPQIGVEFDHNTMQAIDTVQGEEDDKVVSISKPGYKLRDRLVRPAMVVVSKKPVTENKEEKVEDQQASTEKENN